MVSIAARRWLPAADRLRPARVLGLAAALLLTVPVAGNCLSAAEKPVNADVRPAAPVAELMPKRDLLEEVVVLGASASAGFGVRITADHPSGTPVARELNLAAVLEVVLPERTRLRSESTAFFFASPLETGKRQITAAIEAKPTLVVAIDYLFWFGYGVAGGEDPQDEEARRLARLERGLAELERLGDVPIVLGDLPDMSDSVGRMLRERQMPSAAALKAMNERIHAWAQDRPLVRSFPLAKLIDQMRGGEALTIGTVQWSAEEAQQTLQWDRLHPSVDGLIVLAQQALVCLRADGPSAPNAPESRAGESREHDRFVMETEAIRRGLRQRTLDQMPKPRAAPVGAGS